MGSQNLWGLEMPQEPAKKTGRQPPLFWWVLEQHTAPTVDGSEFIIAVEVRTLSHYFIRFIHPRWSQPMLVGGNSNSCWNFHPKPWGRFQITPNTTCASFFHGWVGGSTTTSQPWFLGRSHPIHKPPIHSASKRVGSWSKSGPLRYHESWCTDDDFLFRPVFLSGGFAYQMQEKLQSPKKPSNMWMYLYITMGST